MDTSDEDIYEPCPRKDFAKFGLKLKTFQNVQRKRSFLKSTASTPDVSGLSLDTSNLEYYFMGLRHQLPRPPPLDNQASLWHFIMDQVIDDLNDCCSFKLERVLPLSPKYDYAIALYNSHHISITELEDDEEEDVIRIMKERFGDVVAAQRPQWFFLLEDSIH
ncbi:hypothetical protein F5051DRAFT_435899 [Lentinula edodes]|nr:hypothetical protein F5051DRAFT_435899 [Lentinula edodes]